MVALMGLLAVHPAAAAAPLRPAGDAGSGPPASDQLGGGGAAALPPVQRRLQPAWRQNGPIMEGASVRASAMSFEWAPSRTAAAAAVPRPDPQYSASARGAPSSVARAVGAVPRPSPPLTRWPKRALLGGAAGANGAAAAAPFGRGALLQDSAKLDSGANPAGRCVCAFDFDNTLRIDRDGREDVPTPDASGIIKDCKVRRLRQGRCVCAAAARRSPLAGHGSWPSLPPAPTARCQPPRPKITPSLQRVITPPTPPSPRPPQSKGYGIAIVSANGNFKQMSPVLKRIDGATFDSAFYSSAAYQTGTANKYYELQQIGAYYGTPTGCIMMFDDSERGEGGVCAGWPAGGPRRCMWRLQPSADLCPAVCRPQRSPWLHSSAIQHFRTRGHHPCPARGSWPRSPLWTDPNPRTHLHPHPQAGTIRSTPTRRALSGARSTAPMASRGTTTRGPRRTWQSAAAATDAAPSARRPRAPLARGAGRSACMLHTCGRASAGRRQRLSKGCGRYTFDEHLAPPRRRSVSRCKPARAVGLQPQAAPCSSPALLFSASFQTSAPASRSLGQSSACAALGLAPVPRRCDTCSGVGRERIAGGVHGPSANCSGGTCCT